MAQAHPNPIEAPFMQTPSLRVVSRHVVAFHRFFIVPIQSRLLKHGSNEFPFCQERKEAERNKKTIQNSSAKRSVSKKSVGIMSILGRFLVSFGQKIIEK